MEAGHQDIYSAIKTNYNTNIISHREMNARITELVTRMGALDGAIERMEAVMARQELRIAALEAMVRPTPAEVQLVQRYKPPRTTARVIR